MCKISAIVAMSSNGIIGKNNTLPWGYIKEDMQWFVEHTKNKPVIMGRTTFDSLKHKPLPNRTNIVVSSTLSDPNESMGYLVARDIETALTIADNYTNVDDPEIIVMGGSTIYDQCMPHLDRIYLTVIDRVYDGDTSLSLPDSRWTSVTKKVIDWEDTTVTFSIWDRVTDDHE